MQLADGDHFSLRGREKSFSTVSGFSEFFLNENSEASAMNKQPKQIYEFGRFRLSPADRLLCRDGEVMALTPKCFDLLWKLVEERGHLVEKGELMKTIWPDSFVEEGNLTQNISLLRRALGENSGEPQYIETVPRHGYRFVAEVREVQEREVAPVPKERAGSDSDTPKEISRTASVQKEPTAERTDTSAGRLAVAQPPARRLWPWIVAPILVAVGAIAWWYSRPKSPTPVSRAVPLTSYPGSERNPALSPDGNQVAFTWNGERQDNFDIYLKLIGSGPPLRLTTNPAADVSPAWSPDGRTIAFLRRSEGDRNELLLIPALGGPERKVAETLQARLELALRSLAWSPDGRWLIVAHRERDEQGEALFLISARTGEKRRLTQPPRGYLGDLTPAFSPDGRAVAFSRLSGPGASEVYLQPLSGDFEAAGEARRLTTSGRWAVDPVWTADGRYILHLLAARRGGAAELRRIVASGSSVSEQVSLSQDDLHELTLGRHLVYSRGTGDSNIWRAEIPPPGSPPSRPQLLISSTLNDSQPRYSPDGKKIAFGSTRSGAREIWVAEADGSNPVQTDVFWWTLCWFHELVSRQSAARLPCTSPRAGRFVHDPSRRRDAETSHHGSVRRYLDPVTHRTVAGSTSRVCARDDSRSGRWPLRAVTLRRSPVEADGAPVESPDGKTLYYAQLFPEKGIWKMPVQGGEAVQVTGPSPMFLSSSSPPRVSTTRQHRNLLTST